jgi:hypothetical protein
MRGTHRVRDIRGVSLCQRFRPAGCWRDEPGWESYEMFLRFVYWVDAGVGCIIATVPEDTE